VCIAGFIKKGSGECLGAPFETPGAPLSPFLPGVYLAGTHAGLRIRNIEIELESWQPEASSLPWK